MNKIVAWTIVGSYPTPFLDYSLASIYNVVDEIVIANAGWDFPEMTNDNTPAPEVADIIKRLDVNGKMHELRDEQTSWERLRVLHAETQEKETSEQTGIRARNATIANAYAGDTLIADWVLWIASDQVFYDNVKRLRELSENKNTDGFQFYEHKAFWGSQWQMCRDATDPYSNSDGAKFYKYQGNGGQRQWFKGEGGIMNYRNQTPNDQILTSHVRECWPVQGREELDLVSLLWYQIQRYYVLGLDGNKIERRGWTKQEAFRRAVTGGWNVVQRANWNNLRPAEPIPEVFNAKSPEAYIAGS